MKRVLTILLILLFGACSAEGIEVVRQKNVATRIVFPLLDSSGDYLAGEVAGGNPVENTDQWADGGNPDGMAACSNALVEMSLGVYYILLDAGEVNYDYIVVHIATDNSTGQCILIRTIRGDPALLATEGADSDTLETISDEIATAQADLDAYDTDAEYASAIWDALMASYTAEASMGGELQQLDPNVTFILADTAAQDTAAEWLTLMASVIGADSDTLETLSDQMDLISAGSVATIYAPTTGTDSTVGTENGTYDNYTLGTSDGTVWTITDAGSATDVVCQYEVGAKSPTSVEFEGHFNTAASSSKPTVAVQAYNYETTAYEAIGDALTDTGADEVHTWALTDAHHDPATANEGEVKIRFLASATNGSDVLTIDRIVVTAVPAAALTPQQIWDFSLLEYNTGHTLAAGHHLKKMMAAMGTVATADSTTSFTLSGGQATNDAYNGMMLFVQDADTAFGEARVISDWTSGKVVTVNAAYSFTPAIGDMFHLMACNHLLLTATEIGTAAIGADELAADAIGSSELAATAVAEIQSGLSTYSAYTELITTATSTRRVVVAGNKSFKNAVVMVQDVDDSDWETALVSNWNSTSRQMTFFQPLSFTPAISDVVKLVGYWKPGGFIE